MNKKSEQASNYWQNGEFDKALEIYNGLIESQQAISEDYQGAATCLFFLKRYSEAEVFCVKTLEIYEDLVVLKIILAYIYYYQGLKEKAMDKIKDPEVLNNNSESTLLWLGRFSIDTGNLDLGIKTLKKATTIFPNSVPAHFNLAQAYALEGTTNLKYYHFFQAVRLEPFIKRKMIIISSFLFVPALFVMILGGLFIWYVITTGSISVIFILVTAIALLRMASLIKFKDKKGITLLSIIIFLSMGLFLIARYLESI